MTMIQQLPKTMSGIRVEEPGDTSKLQFCSELAIPHPKENEILIRNEYVGVNYMDTHFRSGRYPATYPLILGGEAAGTVVSAHPSVAEHFTPGARVAYLAKSGAYAQYTAVSATNVVHVPDTISSEVAAAYLAQGLTAVTLVLEAHKVRAGEWILIHGASGGVGILLVQMCTILGARVIATTSSAEKAEMVILQGAEFAINTSAEDWVAKVGDITEGFGVNAIFDPVGQATFEGDLEAIARKGTLVCFGNVSGKVPMVDVLRLGGTKNIKLCYPTVFAYLATKEEMACYANKLFRMIEVGKLRIDRYEVRKMQDIGSAHEELENRKSTGKVVLRMS